MGGGAYTNGFEDLNGTAAELIAFIGEHAHVTEPEARRMLKSNITAFGKTPMLDAFVATQAEMATGLVASPYKFLIGAAKRCRDAPRVPPKQAERKADPHAILKQVMAARAASEAVQ